MQEGNEEVNGKTRLIKDSVWVESDGRPVVVFQMVGQVARKLAGLSFAMQNLAEHSEE